MDDDVHPSGDEGMHRVARKASHEAEGLQPCRYVGRGIGVHRAAATFVTGVHRRQEVHHLGTAHLPDNDPIGTHPQGLAHEVPQRYLSGTLEIGRTSFETNDVWMARPELGGVLHEQNALHRFHHLEKRREESGLARACASTDEEGQPRVDDGPQPQGTEFVDGSEAHEVGQVEAAPVRDAQGDQCAVG